MHDIGHISDNCSYYSYGAMGILAYWLNRIGLRTFVYARAPSGATS
jgi:hypothetical protein